MKRARVAARLAAYNVGMKKRVYLETSVISYLTARPSRDLVTAANQQITREWWESRRNDFDLVVSRYVKAEVGGGDPDAARARIDQLAGIEELPDHPGIEALAKILCSRSALPVKAYVDALHVAAAAVASVDFLLTWNCKHIANAETLGLIESVCREVGYHPPQICTPYGLLGDQSDDRFDDLSSEPGL